MYLLTSLPLTYREASYLLRVRLLEAVDNSHSHGHSHGAQQEHRQGQGQGQGQQLHDLASFIERIGRPWADLRYQHEL